MILAQVLLRELPEEKRGWMERVLDRGGVLSAEEEGSRQREKQGFEQWGMSDAISAPACGRESPGAVSCAP